MNNNVQNLHLVNLRQRGYEVYESRWQTTDNFKENLGFTEHKPRVFRRWARPVTQSEDGTVIQVWNDTLHIHMGHQMIYDPELNGKTYIGHPDELSHWPVDPVEFALSYAPFPMQVFPYEMENFDEGKIGQTYLTSIEMQLAGSGFSPVYKAAPVWAKLVKGETAILGLEHDDEPTIVPVGAVLCLGVSGEPYFMGYEKFQRLYNGDLY